MCGWSTQKPLSDAGQINREDLVYSKKQDPRLLQLCVQMLHRGTCRVESAPCAPCVRVRPRTGHRLCGGLPVSSLVLCRSLIFMISVGAAFAVTAPASLLTESNATVTLAGSCASAWVGSQPPATPHPDIWAMAESYSQNWKLLVFVLALQNAS